MPRSKRVDVAVRGLLFLLTMALAFVLAFATPLTDIVNDVQVDAFGGTYSPKLTFMVLLLLAGAAMTVVYFILRLLILRHIRD